jgi:hypothetical protein
MAAEREIDLHFPKAGIDLTRGFHRQLIRPGPAGDYWWTCVSGNNVRANEPTLNRYRGASRAGLAKYLAGQVAGVSWVVQELTVAVGDGFEPPGGQTVQSSMSGRVVQLVAVSKGRVFTAVPGGTTWAEATNNTGETPPLNITGVMYSAANQQKLWFADGINWCYYNPPTNSVERWSASAGQLPVDSGNNTPRLICTWRGRTVLSGLIDDPHNWFMSAVNDPTDFDYSPESTTPTQAIAGNNAPMGLIGDVVTALIPYSDDVLIFGGDHTIYAMRGDPMQGGQIDLISDAIGISWGLAWCKDPYGTIYFVSNRMGVYSLVPGQLPQRISQPIEQLLQQLDTGANAIRLLWDDRFQGLHVFVTALAAPAACTHYYYETRSGAWWTDAYGNNNLNPLCCTVLDGNGPNDRVPLIGSWDGYVRAVSASATDDDGTAISSSVLIGPILTKDLDDVMLKEVQAVLGASSGAVTYEVLVGATAEQAAASTAVVSGTWSAGRNLTNLIRRAGHAIYIRLSSTNAWQMEAIRCLLSGQGKVRRRGA